MDHSFLHLLARLARVLVLACGVVSTAHMARGELIAGTANAAPGTFGYSISRESSMGVQFYPTALFSLERLELWFFDLDSRTQDTLRVSVREGDASGPSGRVLESFTLPAPATPVLVPAKVTLTSVRWPILRAMQPYWIVVESDADPATCPAWATPTQGGGQFSQRGVGAAWSNVQWGVCGAYAVHGRPAAAICPQISVNTPLPPDRIRLEVPPAPPPPSHQTPLRTSPTPTEPLVTESTMPHAISTTKPQDLPVSEPVPPTSPAGAQPASLSASPRVDRTRRDRRSHAGQRVCPGAVTSHPPQPLAQSPRALAQRTRPIPAAHARQSTGPTAR